MYELPNELPNDLKQLGIFAAGGAYVPTQEKKKKKKTIRNLGNLGNWEI